MHRSWRFAVLAAFVSVACLQGVSSADAPHSRVIVSSTLNHGLLVLDAQTLAFTQPLVPSRGTSPVRMDLERIGGKDYLFTANHGIAGSLGVFDLSGDVVVEHPTSPLPTGGFGSVGVAVGRLGAAYAAAVTNTWLGLGGCGMPAGSLTYFVIGVLNGNLVITNRGVHDLHGSIPFATAIDDARGSVYASTNCGDEVEVFDPTTLTIPPAPAPSVTGLQTIAYSTRTRAGDGPDATLFDHGRDRSYTVNIAGDSLSVIDGATRALATTVPLPHSAPIDATLATSPAGADWILTGNSEDDTFSILGRNQIEECIAAAASACPSAEIARIPAGVDGGAPEGISYDPVSNRVFVVNKNPFAAPSLSAIQLHEAGETVTGSLVGVVPLPAIDPAVPAPAIIAFDTIVDVRA